MAKTRVSVASTGAFLEILLSLKKEPKRYSTLKRDVKKSDKTVAENLRKASSYKLVVKKPTKRENDVFAVYSLTPKGSKFVREILDWETNLSK